MRSMKLLVAALTASILFVASACSAAESTAAFEQGRDYKVVPNVQKPADPKRISVEEFFWYGCSHCYDLDPKIEKWLPTKSSDVDFVRIPNTLGRPEGEIHARAFHAAQTLGILDKVHRPLFEAIHARGLPMGSLDQVRALFVSAAGIKPSDFDGVASGFVVDYSLNKAELQARSYVIRSVPSVVVGGKYIVSGASNMAVIDHLIAKVRKERSS